MGIQFHETEYGRCFFGKQLPDLIKALNRIAEHMEQAAEKTETPDKICVCYQENSRLLAAENGYISDLTATADTAEFQRIIEEWLQSAKDNRYARASTSEKTEFLRDLMLDKDASVTLYGSGDENSEMYYTIYAKSFPMIMEKV